MTRKEIEEIRKRMTDNLHLISQKYIFNDKIFDGKKIRGLTVKKAVCVKIPNVKKYNKIIRNYKFEIRKAENKHNLPHFHVTKGDVSYSFSIETGIIQAESREKFTKKELQMIEEIRKTNFDDFVKLWNDEHTIKIIIEKEIINVPINHSIVY